MTFNMKQHCHSSFY